MNNAEKEEIINFAVMKMQHLIDDNTGKFETIHFTKSNLIKALALDTKDTLQNLSEKQIQQFINSAKKDAECWDLLCAYIEDDWTPEVGVPYQVAQFCIEYTIGKIEKPKTSKSSDSRDFIFLLLAESIAHRFQINFSRNDATSPEDNYTALDVISDACRKIPNLKEKLQFSSLSRLRSNNQFIAQLVDKAFKKRIGHTRRSRSFL
jgi:hypothetical protein